MTRRWLAIPVVLVVLGVGVAGYEIGRHDQPGSTAAKPRTLKRPLDATCGQVGFGSKRFPHASESFNLQTAGALANAYLDTGSNPRELRTAFSLMLLAICNRTHDPAYRPVKQVRSLADQARDLSSQAQTEFPQTLITLAGTEARGKEQVTADQSFVQDANAACRKSAASVKPLVRKIADPTGAFKTPDANRLRPELDALISSLEQIGNRSRASNASNVVTGFTGRVREIESDAARLATLNDHWKKNAAQAGVVASEISQKELELAPTTSEIRDCAEVFQPT
jgi:type I site-specific restriction endonuclease